MIQSNKRLVAAITTILSLFLMSGVSWAQGHEGHNHSPVGHNLKDVSVQKLSKPGSLPEITIGASDAKITIIEYASMTCSRCGRFYRDILPKLKSKYIDTGLARLVVREFPLEKIALAVSTLPRCVTPTKAYEFIAVLYKRQQWWLQRGNIRPKLVEISRGFGMTESKFDACLKDKSLVGKIISGRKRAIEEFGVDRTPTFFINGKPLAGPRSIGEFDKIIEPMLKQ